MVTAIGRGHRRSRIGARTRIGRPKRSGPHTAVRSVYPEMASRGHLVKLVQDDRMQVFAYNTKQFGTISVKVSTIEGGRTN